MQVNAFWVGLVGRQGDNLFSLRNNLRYGCVILKYYIDREKGDSFALWVVITDPWANPNMPTW